MFYSVNEILQKGNFSANGVLLYEGNINARMKILEKEIHYYYYIFNTDPSVGS